MEQGINAIDEPGEGLMKTIKHIDKSGFTLMELMIVVIIIGIVAAFGIPNYDKSIRKVHERDIVSQLTALHASNLLYKSYNGKYWSTGGTTINDLSVINSTLSLNIIANDGTVYNYNSTNGGAFTATAKWKTYPTLQVTESAISASNPCCQIGGCVSVAAVCP